VSKLQAIVIIILGLLSLEFVIFDRFFMPPRVRHTKSKSGSPSTMSMSLLLVSQALSRLPFN
jgi:hypothetical protein